MRDAFRSALAFVFLVAAAPLSAQRDTTPVVSQQATLSRRTVEVQNKGMDPIRVYVASEGQTHLKLLNPGEKVCMDVERISATTQMVVNIVGKNYTSGDFDPASGHGWTLVIGFNPSIDVQYLVQADNPCLTNIRR